MFVTRFGITRSEAAATGTHEDAEQTDRDGRKAKADHSFDETSEDEDNGNEHDIE